MTLGSRSRRPSSGLGEDVRLRGKGLVGSGLEVGGELVELCAFSTPAQRLNAVSGPELGAV